MQNNRGGGGEAETPIRPGQGGELPGTLASPLLHREEEMVAALDNEFPWRVNCNISPSLFSRIQQKHGRAQEH